MDWMDYMSVYLYIYFLELWKWLSVTDDDKFGQNFCYGCMPSSYANVTAYKS